MLKFEFDGFGDEASVLRTPGYEEKESRAKEIVMLRDEENMTFDKIAKRLGITKGTANKIYHKHKNNNS